MRNPRLLLLVFAAAYVVRMGAVWYLGAPVFPDEERFLAAADLFAREFAFSPEMTDMPLPVILFGLLERYFGFGVFGLLAVQSAFSAALVFPAASLASRLHDSDASDLLAGIGCAVYPFFIFYSALVLSETMFLFFLTSAFALVAARRPLPAMVLFGLAHLTRPTGLYFLPVLVLWYLLFMVPSSQVFRHAARLGAGLVVFALLVLPWAVRNWQVHGVVMLGKPSGHPLYEGNNPWNTDGGVSQPDWGWLDHMPPGLSFIERDQWKKEQALAFIAENPQRFAHLAWLKFKRFWSPVPNAPGYDRGIYKWASFLSFGPVLALSLSGVWVLRRKWPEVGLLWLFSLYYTALHMISIGSIRYRLPLEPLLLALAAATLARLASTWKSSRA